MGLYAGAGTKDARRATYAGFEVEPLEDDLTGCGAARARGNVEPVPDVRRQNRAEPAGRGARASAVHPAHKDRSTLARRADEAHGPIPCEPSTVHVHISDMDERAEALVQQRVGRGAARQRREQLVKDHMRELHQRRWVGVDEVFRRLWSRGGQHADAIQFCDSVLRGRVTRALELSVHTRARWTLATRTCTRSLSSMFGVTSRSELKKAARLRSRLTMVETSCVRTVSSGFLLS